MKFVVGKEGSLQVKDRAFVSPEMESRNVVSDRRTKIPASIRVAGSSLGFAIKRGVAEEWVDRGNAWSAGDGKLVYARVLPEDAEADLALLDAAIEDAEAVVKRLRAERQEFLAAHVVRGERISKKHIDALPPKEPTPPPDPKAAEEARKEEARKANAFLGSMRDAMSETLRRTR